MNLFDILSDKHPEFIKMCREHSVSKIYAFGSSITDKFDPLKSDIDLFVELAEEDPLEYGEKLLSLWDGLEKLFGRKVDLLTDNSIRNPILRKNVYSNRVLIYDGEGDKILV
jgi:predicted nucleotidyltransferase